MNTELWFYSAGLLAVRVVLIPRTPSVSRSVGLILAPIVLLATFRVRLGLVGLGGAVSAVTAIYLIAEHVLQRSPASRAALLSVRLASGLVLLGVASVGFGPSSSLEFGPVAEAVTGLFRRLSYFGAYLDAAAVYHLWLYTTAGLYVAFEANYLVALVLNALRIEPSEPSVDGAERRTDERELSRGRVIGILERLLILAFTVSDSVTAIAFILAAKGFARFRELDNKDFAEYVLVGTLLSAGLALAVGFVTRSFTV